MLGHLFSNSHPYLSRVASGGVNFFILSGCTGVQIEQSVMALKEAMALVMVLCRNLTGILRACCKTQPSLEIKLHKFIIK